MKHDIALHQPNHHDPPNLAPTAKLMISFGRNQRHGRVLARVLPLCTEAGMYVEHCARHPKSWIIAVAGATNQRLSEVAKKVHRNLVVAYEST